MSGSVTGSIDSGLFLDAVVPISITGILFSIFFKIFSILLSGTGFIINASVPFSISRFIILVSSSADDILPVLTKNISVSWSSAAILSPYLNAVHWLSFEFGTITEILCKSFLLFSLSIIKAMAITITAIMASIEINNFLLFFIYNYPIFCC